MGSISRIYKFSSHQATVALATKGLESAAKKDGLVVNLIFPNTSPVFRFTRQDRHVNMLGSRFTHLFQKRDSPLGIASDGLDLRREDYAISVRCLGGPHRYF